MTESGIRPIEFNVLVRVREVQKQTAGGIYMPDEVIQRDQMAEMEGQIVDMSPLAFTYDEWPAGSRLPQVGDTVVFTKYAGSERIGKDGNKYRLVKDKDIAAILE
jgi:chaperonin GroES